MHGDQECLQIYKPRNVFLYCLLISLELVIKPCIQQQNTGVLHAHSGCDFMGFRNLVLVLVL